MKNVINNILVLLLLSQSIFSQIEPAFYVNDRGNHAINKYDIGGNFIEVFIESGSGGLTNPQDIVVTLNDTFLVSSFATNQILEYDEAGNFLGVWNQDPVVSPSKMEFDEPNGLLYVTQWGQSGNGLRIAKFHADGTSAGFLNNNSPRGCEIIFDNAQNQSLYVALWHPTGSGVIQQFDSDGNFLGNFIDSTILDAPTYVWRDIFGTGDFLVEDWDQGSILRFSESGVYIGNFITGLSNPEGYAYRPDNGNLLVSERTANKISEFDHEGNLIGQWDNGPELNTPNSILYLESLLLGVEDFEIQKVFVTPTMGSEFKLNTTQTQLLDSLELFTSLGQKVVSLPLKSQNWDANALSEGIYFLVGKNKNNSFFQRIIIKK